MSDSYWAVEIEKRTSNSSDNLVLTKHNPFSSGKFPINIVSFIDQRTINNNNRYILDSGGGQYRYVPASALDYPIIGTIGEFQRDLKGETINYPVQYIQIKMVSCVCVVVIPQSSHKKSFLFDSNQRKEEVKLGIKLTATSEVEIRESTVARFTAITTTKKIKQLKVLRPSCYIDVLYSHGCEGCSYSLLEFFLI